MNAQTYRQKADNFRFLGFVKIVLGCLLLVVAGLSVILVLAGVDFFMDDDELTTVWPLIFLGVLLVSNGCALRLCSRLVHQLLADVEQAA